MPTTPEATGPKSRRTSNADSDSRRRLIEATAEVMRTEGYAAATSRRVAAVAGVKQALVYYYFPTMDDLFIEVMRAGADVALERMRSTLTADEPLEALWAINSDSQWTILSTEFTALANHRKAIGTELKAYAERVRDIETAAVTMVLRANNIDLDLYPPVAISMLITQTARSLCNEHAVGVTQGHAEMRRLVQRLLGQLTRPT